MGMKLHFFFFFHLLNANFISSGLQHFYVKRFLYLFSDKINHFSVIFLVCLNDECVRNIEMFSVLNPMLTKVQFINNCVALVLVLSEYCVV